MAHSIHVDDRSPQHYTFRRSRAQLLIIFTNEHLRYTFLRLLSLQSAHKRTSEFEIESRHLDDLINDLAVEF